MENVKCLIIGSGPSGYTAAIYTSRANLSPVLYEGIEPGGQLTTTTEIENFRGFTEGIDGPKLMDNMRRQALRFGADIRPGVITSVDLSSRPFHVIVNGEKEIQAEALIISTGAAAKYLGLPSEEKFKGMGVSACATCDGFFYRKKDVAVVGGGDTACEEATYLASICRQVYLIVRKPYLRASKAMQERVMNTPNIKVLFEHNTAEVLGDETGVTGALLRDNKGTETKIDIAGFFVAIGHHPNTEIFADQLELDAEGYIKTVAGSSRTSVEGVFAAGDAQDPHYRQAITAAGSGCMAALDCERILLQYFPDKERERTVKAVPFLRLRQPDGFRPFETRSYKTGRRRTRKPSNSFQFLQHGFRRGCHPFRKGRGRTEGIHSLQPFLILRAQVLTGRCDGRMGILLSIPQSERAKKGRKSPNILPPFFDFRGADFDMTTDDTEVTYFKYLPFGEDEEGRKMPYKIEKR